MRWFFGFRKYEHKDDFLPWVTVVIPAYNEEETIGETIDSILSQDYPLKKIIVVDDCSTDNTNTIATSKGVTVLKTLKNTGKKASAQRYGFEHSDTPIVIVVDADTIIVQGSIYKLIQPLSDKNSLSSCGYVIPQKLDAFWERMRMVEYFQGLGLYKNAQENMNCPMVSSGCFTAFRVDILNKLGGLPEDSIAEDMAITWMGHIAGYKIHYVQDAVCYPKDPENFQQYKRQIMRWYRGMFQCIHDFKYSIFKKPLLGIMVVYYIVFGIITSPILSFALVIYYHFISNSINMTLFLILLAIELSIGFSVVAWNGYKHKHFLLSLLYFPTVYISNIINWAAMIVSLFQELVLKNRLALWEKGH